MGKLTETGSDHVSIQRVRGYDEYCVRYRGLKPDRSEAMAYYTDDLEDAMGTCADMESQRHAHVFDGDIANWSFWLERKDKEYWRVWQRA